MRDTFTDVHLLVLTLLLNWVVGAFASLPARPSR